MPELAVQRKPASPGDGNSDSGDDGRLSVLDEEVCVVRTEHFFIRGLVRLPVLDAARVGRPGLLSKDNVARTHELREQEGREREPPMFGWRTTDLPVYDRARVQELADLLLHDGA